MVSEPSRCRKVVSSEPKTFETLAKAEPSHAGKFQAALTGLE